MPESTRPRRESGGLKDFFSPPIGRNKSLRVAGVGVREWMRPSTVARPHGKGDWLIMLFHDPAFASDRIGADAMQLAESLILWPPGVAQYYGNKDARYCHSWIHCDGERVDTMMKACRIPLRKALQTGQGGSFQQALQDIHTELVAWSRPDMIRVGNLLENAIREIQRGLKGGADSQRISENLLKVRRQMAGAPRDLNLEQMATQAGMSVSHFCSEFKRHFGLPPGECLIRQRVQHAAYLLGDHSLSIAEVGERVGYDDPFHFSKMFKRIQGVSPRAYRQSQVKQS